MTVFLNFLLVGVGGFLGSGCRYLTSVFMQRIGEGLLPLGTLSVNGVGSFILGIVMCLAAKSSPIYLLLAVGFCGGFTTFSTFSSETLTLLRSGNISTAVLYIFASVSISLLAVYLGWKVGGVLNRI